MGWRHQQGTGGGKKRSKEIGGGGDGVSMLEWGSWRQRRKWLMEGWLGHRGESAQAEMEEWGVWGARWQRAGW